MRAFLADVDANTADIITSYRRRAWEVITRAADGQCSDMTRRGRAM